MAGNKTAMKDVITIEQYAASLMEWLESEGAQGGGNLDFNSLALNLFRLQFENNAAYAALCRRRGKTPGVVSRWEDIPAAPTTAFKQMEMTSIPAGERVKTFYSSTTTGLTPSRHHHNKLSLALYEASLKAWFLPHLLPEMARDRAERRTFLFLTPPPCDAPGSSLVHMLETIRANFGDGESCYVGKIGDDRSWLVDMEAAEAALEKFARRTWPVLVAGTAFNFVHLLDKLAAAGKTYALPSGSRAMETGGYKGKSRELTKSGLHAAIRRQLGIPGSHIVCEYGMCELSSQAYDGIAGSAGDGGRVFRFPPWARARVVSPETGCEVADGEGGMIQIFDLANAWSVLAIQTEDLGVRRGDGFELTGRAARAEPRGCSLMAGEMEMHTA